MKNKLKAFIYPLISVIFWIAVWQIISCSVKMEFVFPRLDKTLVEFFNLVISQSFWSIVLASVLRISLGFLLGALLGILLAPITNYVPLLRSIISPMMTVIKSTPVASFILVLWCIIGKASVPTAISLLMVMPIVWQNLTDGYQAVSASLSEVCDVFEVTGFKRFRLLVFPTLVRYLIPALITSSALAWKSGVAAEIIVYAKNSIGKEITDAKNLFESERMFAWTIAVVLLSILIEFSIKRLAGRAKKI